MSISKGVLSKIHIAKGQLGMDDDSYRALLRRVAGVESAKDLNTRQVGRLMVELERLGFKPQPSSKAKGKPHNAQQLGPRIDKIEAQLADMRLPWAYADALARQMFKVEKVAWLKKAEQLDALIAALHVEQEKRQLLDQVETLCKRLGVDTPERLEGLEELPEGWRRQRPILKALVDALNAAVNAQEGD
ncbi:gp16 family protein [Pseudomonas wenzhouensis]|uniref:gp16 family protein n=1 Tax=Pseudomonas wenzhouensis TaxID=2906062 RepID=UPI0015CD860B|nr:regulatory protein GemA [Pseudomonas wenzhouensis]UFQ97008.1 regulatory protein GemA [Pseudomonas wenzhouensis]